MSCPNKACEFFGLKGQKNIVKRGKKKNGARNYTCTACGRCFARTACTMFYRSRIKRKEAKQILKLLAEKNGIRKIGRITQKNKNTIKLFTDKLAYNCKEANNNLLKDIKLSPAEIGELWAFIKKSKRKLSKKTLKTINKEIISVHSIKKRQKTSD